MFTSRTTLRTLPTVGLPAAALALALRLRPGLAPPGADPEAAAAVAIWVLLVAVLTWWTISAVAFGLALVARSERWTVRTARVTPRWIRQAIAGTGALAFVGLACIGSASRPASAATAASHPPHRTSACPAPGTGPTTTTPPSGPSSPPRTGDAATDDSGTIVRDPGSDPIVRDPGPDPEPATTTAPIVRADPGTDAETGPDAEDDPPVVTPDPQPPATNPTPTSPTPAVTAPAVTAPAVIAPVPVEGDPTTTHHHVVTSGESLWTIARDVLRESRHENPTDAQLAPYWRKVVAANRATLRSGNPNLIFPGEVVVLPPV